MGEFKHALLNQLYQPMRSYTAPHVEDARILVTGAGGSIGAVICKELLRFKPRMLAMLDAYDGNIYSLSESIGLHRSEKNIRYFIGSVRDQGSLRAVFAETAPTLVFHVAALKHVPMLEDPMNIVEAAWTNVLGTYNVALECLNMPQCVMVNVSTDKAVRPSSILGVTKRCAEVYVHNLARRLNAPMASVRFGNVLDSIGSVIPLFRNQVLSGGPVTVTDDRMTRYFMSRQQAASLTIQASGLIMQNMGAHCYMIEMGEQIRIVDLVDALIEEYGDQSISKQFIGIRPGEKLHEELHYPWEKINRTSVDGITALSGDVAASIATMDELSWSIRERRVGLVTKLMRSIVPDYVGKFDV